MWNVYRPNQVGKFYRKIFQMGESEIETSLAGEIENPICKAVLDKINEHIESKLQATLNVEMDLPETKWYLGATEALFELSETLEELMKNNGKP